MNEDNFCSPHCEDLRSALREGRGDAPLQYLDLKGPGRGEVMPLFSRGAVQRGRSGDDQEGTDRMVRSPFKSRSPAPAKRSGGGGGRAKLKAHRAPPAWNDAAKWSSELILSEETEILDEIRRHEFVDFRVFADSGECLGQITGEVQALGSVTRDGRVLEEHNQDGATGKVNDPMQICMVYAAFCSKNSITK